MRNAVAFANNDVATIAWSYGAKPEGCMGFALYRIDSKGRETALPSHAVFPGETIAPGQTTAQFPVQKFYWKDVYARLLRSWRRFHSDANSLPVQISYAETNMRNNSEHSFAIIRFNEKTYISGGVMAVVKGTESAQRTLNDFEWCQSQEDRSSGWRYFVEESDLQPGTDPAKATKLRQLRLDLQESQAKSL